MSITFGYQPSDDEAARNALSSLKNQGFDITYTERPDGRWTCQIMKDQSIHASSIEGTWEGAVLKAEENLNAAPEYRPFGGMSLECPKPSDEENFPMGPGGIRS